MRIAWGPCIALAAVALVTACNPDKEVRNRECGEYAEWSNHSGDPITAAVPDAEKQAADTNEKRAAFYRKLAEGARQAAKGPIPFQNEYVRGLAVRQLQAFEEVATSLDHQAEAWQAGDAELQKKAAQEEMAAKAKQTAVADEWQRLCHR
jgi:hypothetical protein